MLETENEELNQRSKAIVMQTLKGEWPHVAKEDIIELEGVVEEVLPNAMFRVRINENYLLTGIISGKMRQHRIQILLGDKVKLEVSPYDLTKGRITYRTK